MVVDNEIRARCEFQLETINMFNRQLFVLSTSRSFRFLPNVEISSSIQQMIKVKFPIVLAINIKISVDS